MKQPADASAAHRRPVPWGCQAIREKPHHQNSLGRWALQGASSTSKLHLFVLSCRFLPALGMQVQRNVPCWLLLLLTVNIKAVQLT